MLGRVPALARFCSRAYATAHQVTVVGPQTLSEDLRAAKDISMVRIVQVFRSRKEEFTPGHCLAALVMMDSEASERAHTTRGYEFNMEATAKLPETRRMFEIAAENADKLEPHMFGNLLMIAHAFGFEQYHETVPDLSRAAKEKLPQLTEEALEQILDQIGHDKQNYWSTLVQSYLPERPKEPKKLPVANVKDTELVEQRQPLLKLLNEKRRGELSDDDLARLADTSISLGAIDPNDLHRIVAAYANVGVRNVDFLRRICNFAIDSWRQLTLENLCKLRDEFERIGFRDKTFVGHLVRRMPYDPEIAETYETERVHSQTMAILTKMDRPWSEPRWGKPYGAPEWDSGIDNRHNFFMLQRRLRLSAQFKEENTRRVKQGLPRLPPDSILCPWLDERIYGGKKKAPVKTPKHKLFSGFQLE